VTKLNKSLSRAGRMWHRQLSDVLVDDTKLHRSSSRVKMSREWGSRWLWYGSAKSHLHQHPPIPHLWWVQVDINPHNLGCCIQTMVVDKPMGFYLQQPSPPSPNKYILIVRMQHYNQLHNYCSLSMFYDANFLLFNLIADPPWVGDHVAPMTQSKVRPK